MENLFIGCILLKQTWLKQFSPWLIVVIWAALFFSCWSFNRENNDWIFSIQSLTTDENLWRDCVETLNGVCIQSLNKVHWVLSKPFQKQLDNVSDLEVSNCQILYITFQTTAHFQPSKCSLLILCFMIGETGHCRTDADLFYRTDGKLFLIILEHTSCHPP